MGKHPIQVKAFRKLRKNDPKQNCIFTIQERRLFKIKLESFVL
jgi:hypothetical protein